MQHHDEGRNGYLSWNLVGIISSIETRLGGLQTGQDLTIEQLRFGFDRVHQRIDNLHLHGNKELDKLHHRVTKIEMRSPPATGLMGFLGLSAKELVWWLTLIAMSTTGTLTSDTWLAWLQR